MGDKRRVLVLAATLVAAVLAAGLWDLASRGRRAAERPAAAGALYQCSMHPQIVRSEPGLCPICHMPLREIRREPAGAQGSVPGRAGVSLDPARRQLFGVRTAAVERRSLSYALRASGRVARDPELYTAIAEHLQAVQAFSGMRGGPSSGESRALTEALVQASRTRLRALGLGEEQIDKLSSEGGGPPGELLLPRKGGKAWVYADVYQGELALVRPGLKLEARLDARPGLVLSGRVLSVDPVLDPMTRTARVRAELPNTEGLLRPEMYLDVLIFVPLGVRLAVPRDAVLDTGERQIAFVARGEGEFLPRAVRTRPASEQFAEVLAGLEEGERVVSSANFLIDSESQLRAALESFGTGAAPMGHRH